MSSLFSALIIISRLQSHSSSANWIFFASSESFTSVASQLYPYQNFPASGPTSKYLPLRSFEGMSGLVARRREVRAPFAGGMLTRRTIEEVTMASHGGKDADSVSE